MTDGVDLKRVVSKGRTVGELEDLFAPQRESADCLPACVYSIWEEFRDRLGRGRRMAREKVENACGYYEGIGSGPKRPQQIYVELREEYFASPGVRLQGSFPIPVDDLENDLETNRVSFPILAFPPRYLSGPDMESGTGEAEGGHWLVLVNLEDDEAILYDPLVPHEFAHASGFKSITREDLTSYWQDASPPQEAMWIRDVQQGLEEV